jgi:F-type H+-transporting ATPase subunit gamma
MSNLKEVRTRIESVKSTQQITSAMKLVAASKLRRAQTSILQLRPYAKKLQEFIQYIGTGSGQEEEMAYFEKREEENVLIVVITSNRGLCGAFNTNVIKHASKLIHQDYGELFAQGKLALYCIGKKGAEFFTNQGYPVVEKNTDIFDNLNYENVLPIAEALMQDFINEKYNRIIMVYNHFKNPAVQQLVSEQYLPLTPVEAVVNGHEIDFIFEPDKASILSELIPKNLKIQFYKALLNSYASEHGARMTAMHMATENATELLKELRLKYNKVRQASITSELLEIVGGAEALKG